MTLPTQPPTADPRVRLDRDGPLAPITLDRPMLHALGGHLADLRHDSDPRAPSSPPAPASTRP